MTFIVYIIKKHGILPQTVIKVHELFHITNKLIAAVKDLHFSGVEKWSSRTICTHVLIIKAKTKGRSFPAGLCNQKKVELISRNVT